MSGLRFGRVLSVSVLMIGIGASEAFAQDQSWREKAVEAIAADEPSVVEAIFPNDAPNSFWASGRVVRATCGWVVRRAEQKSVIRSRSARCSDKWLLGGR